MTSRAEQKRRRRNRRLQETAQQLIDSGFALKPSRRREPNGQYVRGDRPDPTEQIATLRSRCRDAGLPATEDNLADARSASWEGAGLALVAAGLPERGKREAAVWGALLGARVAYARHVLDSPRSGGVWLPAVTPEVVETRPDDKPDLRSQDEKSRDAANAWAYWATLAARLRPVHRTAITAALYTPSTLIRDGGGISRSGSIFAEAMVALADEHERRSRRC